MLCCCCFSLFVCLFVLSLSVLESWLLYSGLRFICLVSCGFLLCHSTVPNHLWRCRQNTLFVARTKKELKQEAHSLVWRHQELDRTCLLGLCSRGQDRQRYSRLPGLWEESRGGAAPQIKGGVQSSFDSSSTSRNGWKRREIGSKLCTQDIMTSVWREKHVSDQISQSIQDLRKTGAGKGPLLREAVTDE